MSTNTENNVVQLKFDFNKKDNKRMEDDADFTLYEYQTGAVETLGPDRDPLMLALGVGGEAGEVMEIIKKGNRPGKEVDTEHLKEEIGDVLWYLAVLADYYELDLEEIALDNLEKLEKRYGKETS